MTDQKPRAVGVNHIALDVGNIDEALRFYDKVFSFELRRTHRDDFGHMDTAFIDMGDQFLALSPGRSQPPDTSRHFGLVVDDRSKVMALTKAAGATVVGGRPFSFLRGETMSRSWNTGTYRSRKRRLLDALGVSPEKSDEARAQMAAKGFL